METINLMKLIQDYCSKNGENLIAFIVGPVGDKYADLPYGHLARKHEWFPIEKRAMLLGPEEISLLDQDIDEDNHSHELVAWTDKSVLYTDYGIMEEMILRNVPRNPADWRPEDIS